MEPTEVQIVNNFSLNLTSHFLNLQCVFLVFKPRVCFAIEEDSWIRIFILGSCTLLQYTHICVVKCTQIWSLILKYWDKSGAKPKQKQQKTKKMNYELILKLAYFLFWFLHSKAKGFELKRVGQKLNSSLFKNIFYKKIVLPYLDLIKSL